MKLNGGQKHIKINGLNFFLSSNKPVSYSNVWTGSSRENSKMVYSNMNTA